MAEMFGHEKLKVYEKTIGFVGLRSELLARIDRKVAACDHLERGAESILPLAATCGKDWSYYGRSQQCSHHWQRLFLKTLRPPLNLNT